VSERYLADPNVLSAYWARVGVTGQADWMVTDLLGSVRALVSAGGSVEDQIAYDAYGNVVSETNPSAGGRLKYAGGQYDGGLGLTLFGARWYNSAAGRWLSQDPLGLGPDSNPYRYVGNGPTDGTDPSGLDMVDNRARILAAYAAAMQLQNVYAQANGHAPPLTEAQINAALAYGWQHLGVDNYEPNPLYNDWLNQLDRFFAGWAHSLTGGRSSLVRERWYGETATRNHQGTAFEAGRVWGNVHNAAMLVTGSAAAGRALANAVPLGGGGSGLALGTVGVGGGATGAALPAAGALAPALPGALTAGYGAAALYNSNTDPPISTGGSQSSGVPQHALDTLDTIDQTGAAPPGYRGGGQFMNDGRGGGEILPQTTADGQPITYQEWDVHPFQPGVNRGPERLVTGSDGSAYYTSDHYRSFTRIR
jgi:RHS repeat-associated protein